MLRYGTADQLRGQRQCGRHPAGSLPLLLGQLQAARVPVDVLTQAERVRQGRASGSVQW